MNNVLVLEVYDSTQQENNAHVNECSLETLIVLCVYKFCKIDLPIQFVKTKVKCRENDIKLNLEDVRHTVVQRSDLPWQVRSCKLPAVFTDSTIITGLCAVSRHLCKCRKSPPLEVEHPKGILGFRTGCLQAPNEVSVWTKFCEIELLDTTRNILEARFGRLPLESNATFEIPNNVARFEKHLKQPLRVHNVYKVAREAANKSYEAQKTIFVNNQPELSTSDSEKTKQSTLRTNVKYRNWKSKNRPKYIDSSTPIDDLELEHLFAEGPFLTLADLILYPCYTLTFPILGQDTFSKCLPRTSQWFNNIKSLDAFEVINNFLSEVFADCIRQCGLNAFNVTYTMPDVKDVSLYKCDPKRSNPKKRLFTKECDVESALDLIAGDMKLILNLSNPGNTDCKIDWSSIPSDANPHGGHLPDKRMERKTQQLENVALAVMHLARDGDRVIDFCCGSGHLGILLAYLLPKCTIVLLENKEESLNRAKARVKNLELKNIYFFQCNLDYFVGDFDIGVALHACGIATDLVLENCINKNASFVVCPCCYGSLHVTERLHYPRSKDFSNIPLEKYMCIGHAADQTHVDHPMEERGTKCMTIIDSDRARHAMNNGYRVRLTRLRPLSCTPKNMLIVGTTNLQIIL